MKVEGDVHINLPAYVTALVAIPNEVATKVEIPAKFIIEYGHITYANAQWCSRTGHPKWLVTRSELEKDRPLYETDPEFFLRVVHASMYFEEIDRWMEESERRFGGRP